ncbi:retropepsin-like aspartic protease [Zymomonas mobilis]|uniref:retropepsin-like aspartic protease n=1 Tax=Zymomonas mobilis TaxID=542 RepID=UPI0021C2E9AF|nr:retropepsin-like aspartic protease [Zymomonas mobilis]MCP9306984.1 retropepsin-like domain-containing protein [Zymomonas mobilis]
MPKKYQFLLYPLLLNSVLLPPLKLKAAESLPSSKLVDFLKQQSPQTLKEGLKVAPGGDESTLALYEGDSLHLQKMIDDPKRTSFEKKFINTDLLRTKGDFKEADRQLEICHQTYFMEGSGIHLSPINLGAMICDQILAGNYFLEGNLAAWGKEIDDIKNTYYPPIRKFAGLEQFSLFDIKMGSLSVAPNSIPPFTVTGIDQQQTLPLQSQKLTQEGYRRSTWNVPYLTASLNGTDFSFFLGTDTAISFLPKALSHSSHVHIVGHIEIATNGRGEAYNGDLGIVDELKIGTTVLKNVPFLFTNTDEASLGLMVLQKLGKIKINRQHFTFGKDIDCHCQKDIQLGSIFDGRFYAIRYPITWQGKTEMAAIDLSQSDARFSFMLFQPDFTPEEEKQSFEISKEIDGTKVTASIYLKDGNLSIDGIDYGKRQKSVQKDKLRIFSKVMTITILEKADLYLDFINHKACLKPNNSDATPIPQ